MPSIAQALQAMQRHTQARELQTSGLKFLREMFDEARVQILEASALQTIYNPAFAGHVCDAPYLKEAAKLSASILQLAKSPSFSAPVVAISGLTKAISKNLDGPAEVERELTGKLLDFVNTSNETALVVALHGDLCFLCNRDLQGENQQNSKNLLKALQDKALPSLRAMISVLACRPCALPPLLYLSSKDELLQLLRTPGSDICR